MRGFVDGQVVDELNPSRDPYQFTAQADHFSHCVQNNLEPNTPGEEGLKDMRWIAEIYRSAGIAVG
jgi:predicted dehydrogenase